jgi:TRAP-type mannitol/chloroaromatic compound transport system permease large subunit
MTQVQMDYLTPPFGFCLFCMKGVAPLQVSMGNIYRSILPFILIQLAVVIFIPVFPEVVMWLPDLLFN